MTAPDDTLPVLDDPGLDAALEALLLVVDAPTEEEQLAVALEQPVERVRAALLRLSDAYAAAGRGFDLRRTGGGWRFYTRDAYAPYVERFLLDGQRARMSGAALETLAIVAYKQPLSRAQIASIRGVDPDGVLRTLQARGYITEVARDSGPGQAILYGTTQVFLEKLGLNSLADLPPIAEFVPGADVVEALEQGLRIDVPAPDAPA